jgi:hypothetical protein
VKKSGIVVAMKAISVFKLYREFVDFTKPGYGDVNSAIAFVVFMVAVLFETPKSKADTITFQIGLDFDFCANVRLIGNGHQPRSGIV